MAQDRLEIRPQAVYTLADACEILQVSPATLHRWIKEGKVPTARVGRGHRFLGSQLLAVLEATSLPAPLEAEPPRPTRRGRPAGKPASS